MESLFYTQGIEILVSPIRIHTRNCNSIAWIFQRMCNFSSSGCRCICAIPINVINVYISKLFIYYLSSSVTITVFSLLLQYITFVFIPQGPSVIINQFSFPSKLRSSTICIHFPICDSVSYHNSLQINFS